MLIYQRIVPIILTVCLTAVVTVALATVVFAAEISPETLLAGGLAEIKAIPRFADKAVSLNFVKTPPPVQIGTGNYTLKAELSARELAPVFFIKYSVFRGNEFVKAFRLRCRAEVWTDGYYARRRLTRGETVTLEDFYPARTDILRFSRHLAEITEFQGEKVLTTDLASGEPLMTWMLGARQLVNAGDRIALYVISEGVIVKTAGKALQAGTLGDRILVQLQNDRKRTLKSEITGAGECRIVL